MARRNPELDALTRENDALRRQLAELRRDPGDMPVKGCGDNSCVVAQPKGMATNGGCRCELREVRGALHYWRRLARFRETTIREMVDDVARAKVATSMLDAMAKDVDVRVTVIVSEHRSISLETLRKEDEYRVTDDRGAERRSVRVRSAPEAADYFTTWLREAQEQEMA